jgi:hypothetical protein
MGQQRQMLSIALQITLAGVEASSQGHFVLGPWPHCRKSTAYVKTRSSFSSYDSANISTVKHSEVYTI